MDEIMEDGNLVDRVRILLQRDMQYYQVINNLFEIYINKKKENKIKLLYRAIN